jgi:hypothetical protein
MPDSPWVMTQTWNDLLFAHWPIDPRELDGRIPAAFPIDLFEGQAWIGIVPFHMTNVAPRGLPSLPWVSQFPELNVRTYVSVDDRPGVFFFSLDAGSPVAVHAARALLNLPYYAAAMTVTTAAGGVQYHSARKAHTEAVFEGFYAPAGPPSLPVPGSLAHFLTERYCLYNLDHRGNPYRMEIHHPPWPLQTAHAQWTRNTMAAVNGIRLPNRPPLLHFSRRQDMVAWAPARVG